MNEPMVTRQGVRNLNGPKLDGRNHNGRSISCEHYRNPETPTLPEMRIVNVDTPEQKLVRVHLCAYCRELRFTDEED